MLVLTQGVGATVIITIPDGREIRVMVCSNIAGKIRMGYSADPDIVIDREVVHARKRKEREPPEPTDE